MTDPANGDPGPAESTGSPATETALTGIRRCEYCRLPIPHEPIEMERDEQVYAFCSDASHAAIEQSEWVFR